MLEKVEQIQQRARQARQQEDAARSQFEQAKRAREFWDELEDEVSAEHAAQVVFLLNKAEGYLSQLKVSGDPLGPVLDDIQKEAEERARAAAATFGRQFPEAVREAGMEIDSTSRQPRYTFKRGFIRIEVDERHLTANLAPRDGEEIVMGMDVGPLVERLKSEMARIFDRPLNQNAFLKSLYTAYTATLRVERRNEGEEVPLRRVTNRLAKNLNRFAADEFNVDLARLIKSGSLVIENQRLHLNHTRNLRQGMLLHELEGGGYVGFISFKKEARP